MNSLTIQERRVLIAILLALVLGAAVRYWRRQGGADEAVPVGEKVAGYCPRAISNIQDERWREEDKALDKRLADLKKKHGKTPNIVYILWDDMAFGDAGIPAINKIRGFDTPNCNKIAEEGIMFTRMYVEPSCTPTRAAFMTGRQPYRNGMYIPGFPVENGVLPLKKLPWQRCCLRQVMLQPFMAKGI